MTTFNSYRSSASQKNVLTGLIYTTLTYCPPQPEFVLQNKTVFTLTAQFQKLLDIADLSGMPLDQMLDNLIAASHNYQGTMSERRAKALESTAQLLLARVHECIDQNDLLVAFNIVAAILKTYAPAYRRISPALIECCSVKDAFEFLASLGNCDLAPELHTIIFQFCVDNYRQTITDRYNLKVEWLFAMAHYVSNAGQENILLELCAQHESPYKDDEHAMDRIGDETLEVLLIMHQRTKSPEAVRIFIEANLRHDGFRRRAFDIAMEGKDMDLALHLCEQRIFLPQAQGGRSGLYHWYVCWLKAAQQAADQATIRKAALWLLQEFGDFKYYKLLRENTDAFLWSQHWDEYIEPLREKKSVETLLQVYVLEKEWQNLEYLLPNLSSSSWLKFEQLLADNCPQVLVKHFDLPVWIKLKSKNTQFSENEVADYLCRMRERFGLDKVTAVVSLVKACYPRRKKLLDTLQNKLAVG